MGTETKLKNLYAPSGLRLPCRPTPLWTNGQKSCTPFLSFRHGGTAQVFSGNKTTAVIDGMSQMHMLDEFLVHIKRTFGDLDWVRMA